jgi:ElaB/YqjD/DUF883 family membrane-anchored ribosome-binding protein
MKHNSEKSHDPITGRIPLVVVEEGRKMLRRARKAGITARTVARQSRRFVGETVDRTGRYTKRHPWGSLGSAACAGACIGALLTFLFIPRD